MRLSDIQPHLSAPLPSHLVGWRPQAFTKDRSRALLLAYIDARMVMDRLDAVCPGEWSFEIEVVPGTSTPTVKGRLTVLGVSREDIGEASGEGEYVTLKAATSDALKRCAVHFGIGRYLYDLPKQWVDWDDARRQPAVTPELPEWALPDFERSPGGAHLVQALEQLRYDLPEDVSLQRECYKHLKAALTACQPGPQFPAQEPEAETDLPPADPISKRTKSQIAAHLESKRWGLDRETRLAFTAWLADRRDAPLASSAELTEAEGRRALSLLETCVKPKALLDHWRANPAGLPGEVAAMGAVS